MVTSGRRQRELRSPPSCTPFLFCPTGGSICQMLAPLTKGLGPLPHPELPPSLRVKEALLVAGCLCVVVPSRPPCSLDLVLKSVFVEGAQSQSISSGLNADRCTQICSHQPCLFTVVVASGMPSFSDPRPPCAPVFT